MVVGSVTLTKEQSGVVKLHASPLESSALRTDSVMRVDTSIAFSSVVGNLQRRAQAQVDPMDAGECGPFMLKPGLTRPWRCTYTTRLSGR